MNGGNNDEADLWKEVEPTPPLEELKGGSICFYPGTNPGAPALFEDFLGALEHVGDCEALVYSEVNRSRSEVRRMMEWHKGNLAIPIPGGFINKIEMENPAKPLEVDRDRWFPKPGIQWIPPEGMPDQTRLWADYALLTIETGTELKPFHLLHIGIGGLAAWLWFFQAHNLRVVRVIATAP